MFLGSLGEPLLPRVYRIQHFNCETKPQNVLLIHDPPRQQILINFVHVCFAMFCRKLTMRKCCESEFLSSLVMLEPKQKPSQTQWPNEQVLQWHISSHAPACLNKTSAQSIQSAHGDTGQQPESGLQEARLSEMFEACRDLAKCFRPSAAPAIYQCSRCGHALAEAVEVLPSFKNLTAKDKKVVSRFIL